MQAWLYYTKLLVAVLQLISWFFTAYTVYIWYCAVKHARSIHEHGDVMSFMRIRKLSIAAMVLVLMAAIVTGCWWYVQLIGCIVIVGTVLTVRFIRKGGKIETQQEV